MKHNDFSINTSNENGMTSKILYDGFKTKVVFGFEPEKVGFLGKVDKDVFNKINSIAKRHD